MMRHDDDAGPVDDPVYVICGFAGLVGGALIAALIVWIFG